MREEPERGRISHTCIYTYLSHSLSLSLSFSHVYLAFLAIELDLPRYKFMVQVAIGEQRGEGARMGLRCFWDSTTDNYASDTYTNDSLFCVATAYAVYCA
jgi:hypothetical protein